MSKQPEALRLAGEPFWTDDDCASASAELRRLHALCEEMGEALDNAHGELKGLARAPDSAYARPSDESIKEIEAVLAKWKESK